MSRNRGEHQLTVHVQALSYESACTFLEREKESLKLFVEEAFRRKRECEDANLDQRLRIGFLRTTVRFIAAVRRARRRRLRALGRERAGPRRVARTTIFPMSGW